MANITALSRISNYSAQLSQVREVLENGEISSLDTLQVTDAIDAVAEGSLRIQKEAANQFSRLGADRLMRTCEDLTQKIAKIEEKRQSDDEELLQKFHTVAYQIDMLAINFFKLTPYEIENCLTGLDFSLDDIKKSHPYNVAIFHPQIIEAQNKLNDLHFRYDFPIVEELNPNQYSFAHRTLLEVDRCKDFVKAKELRQNLKDLNFLTKIARAYAYADQKKADLLFESLDLNTKNEIEHLVWQHSAKTIEALKNDPDKKDILSAVLMNIVASRING
ncbi:MAG: hypothetical protein JXA94_07125 [Parachlamydiales bacterium]|nr:hypothetical protein [Parachlamydiales bacterium]